MNIQHLAKTSFWDFLRTIFFIGLVSFLGSMNAYAAPTNDFRILHDFDGDNGATPSSGVTQGVDGSLYGATIGGGEFNEGTVYKLDANGNYSLLHRFCSDCGDDSGGIHPDGGITIKADGSLVGTSTVGGLGNNADIYKIDVNGAFSILFGAGYHRALPGPLALGSDGSLYGTVSPDPSVPEDFGLVYRIDPSGTVSALHVFGNEYVGICCIERHELYDRIGLPDGGLPMAGITLGADGSLYGTTSIGGTLKKGQGVVFKINATGVFSVVHSFDDAIYGAEPSSSVIVASDGSLFGTTASGGLFGFGVIYKIDPNGAYSVLHNFDSYNLEIPGQGFNYLLSGSIRPNIIMSNDGSIYGTIFAGGSLKFGIIYKLDPNGNYSVIHDFDKANGAGPNGISFGRDGKLNGTTAYGGQFGFGTVYSMSLAPAKATTLSTLSTNVSTAVFGKPVSLNVSVKTSNPTPFAPAGMVSLMDGSSTLSNATLNGNTATFTTANLSVGAHSLTARYAGDANNAASVSNPISLTITPVNVAPVAVNDAFTLVKHGKSPVTVAAPGVLGNDTDADGNKLTIVGATAATPRTIALADGSLALYADGHFIYTPSNDKESSKGTSSFTYQATDGQAASNTAIVALTMKNISKEHGYSDHHKKQRRRKHIDRD